jgi:hypothetical protein
MKTFLFVALALIAFAYPSGLAQIPELNLPPQRKRGFLAVCTS